MYYLTCIPGCMCWGWGGGRVQLGEKFTLSEPIFYSKKINKSYIP